MFIRQHPKIISNVRIFNTLLHYTLKYLQKILFYSMVFLKHKYNNQVIIEVTMKKQCTTNCGVQTQLLKSVIGNYFKHIFPVRV